MVRGMIRLGALVGLAVSAPAWAQQAKTAGFNVGGSNFELPIPDGFCLPTAATATAAEMLKKADPGSATHVSLFACDYATTDTDYYLVKTPAALVSTPVTRAQLLPEIAREFASPNLAAQITPEKLNSQTREGLSGAVGKDVSVDVQVAPRGTDEVCGYMSGIMNYEMGGKAYKVEISGCMSAVGDRVILVFYYHDGDDAAAALRNTAKAKAMMLSIRATGAR